MPDTLTSEEADELTQLYGRYCILFRRRIGVVRVTIAAYAAEWTNWGLFLHLRGVDVV